MHIKRCKYLHVRRAAAAVLVGMVFRKPAVFVYDVVFLIEHNRGAVNIVGCFRNHVQRRARVVETRDWTHSTAARTVPDYRQAYAVR